MNRKIIISTLMATMFIVSGIAVAMNSSFENTNELNTSAHRSLANSELLSARSGSIALQFDKWYRETYNGRNPNSMKNFTITQRDMVFSNFIHYDSAGRKSLMIRTNSDIKKFDTLNLKHAEVTLFDLIHENKVINYSKIESLSAGNKRMSIYYSSNSSNSFLVHIETELPKGVSFDSGEWIMVSIDYFVYHAPWWLGGWSVTYGEQDQFNELWAGCTAQTNYNNFENTVNVGGLTSGVAVSSITGLITAGAIGGSWGGPIGVIAGAIVAVIAGLVVIHLDNTMTSLYESTYANEPSGNKYIWIYFVNDYYYPWITVVGSFYSTIGMYGYLSSGQVETFFGNNPWISYNGIQAVTVSAYFSSYVHSIADNYGSGTWVYS